MSKKVTLSDPRELRWKIDAYTVDTMPLDRLAEYLKELSVLLGEPEKLHLVRVVDGSTVPVLKIDREAVVRVRERVAAVRVGSGPADAERSYRNINRMLREDDGKASLVLRQGKETAEILPFPGRDEEISDITGVQQQGSLDGQLQKVGGSGRWVPLHLRTMDDKTVTGCFATRNLAKQMGPYLFEPVRLYGRGRWTRTNDGQWLIEKFYVDTFETLSNDPLPDVVATLRSVRADWIKNPVADIRRVENEQ